MYFTDRLGGKEAWLNWDSQQGKPFSLPSQRNFPISFKPKVAIAQFFWKMQRKTWYSILGVDAIPLSLKNLLLRNSWNENRIPQPWEIKSLICLLKGILCKCFKNNWPVRNSIFWWANTSLINTALRARTSYTPWPILHWPPVSQNVDYVLLFFTQAQLGVCIYENSKLFTAFCLLHWSSLK